MDFLQAEIEKNQDKLLKDLAALVKIPSVRDLDSARPGAPFGKNIRLAMDEFLRIAQDLGFQVADLDGYAVYAQLGDEAEHLGILGHLDVVEAGDLERWETPAYELTVRDDLLLGRGVNDDKGPLLGALYAAKLAYDLLPGPKQSVRVIAGGAEESTWECVDYYFKKEPQPVLAFSPDGNFPVVNGEKGVLQVKLTFQETVKAQISSSPAINFVCSDLVVDGQAYEGDQLLSRNPHRGLNAIDAFMDTQPSTYQGQAWYDFIANYLHHDYQGQALGLDISHEEMGSLSVCMMSLKTNADQQVELALDFRYPVNVTQDEILDRLGQEAATYHFKLEKIKAMKPLYVSKDSSLVNKLLDAYESVMGDRPTPITKGGASYARALENGVAFGATFDGEDTRPHMTNENMKLSSLKKAMEIYVRAIQNLIGY